MCSPNCATFFSPTRTPSLGDALLCHVARAHAPNKEEAAILYLKNVPTWERILRLIMSFTLLFFAYQNWGSSYLGVGLGVMGAMLAMTGLVGYCPMCALAGRTLDRGP